MENARIRFVFDKNKKADNTKNKGLLHVEVRLSKTNKSVYISTGLKFYKNQIDIKQNTVCKSSVPNSAILNGEAMNIFRKIERFIYSDRCKAIDDVKYWNQDNAYSNESFIKYIESKILIRSKALNLSFSTVKQHNSLLNKLKAFNKIKTFADVNNENIESFDLSMKEDGLIDVSAKKKHSILKVYIKEAINDGRLNDNPYDRYKIRNGKSKDPIFLLPDEINKIKKFTPDYGYLERARDLFLFQCYTGLALIAIQL